jgi:uncharacterized protein YndB with AHSA1/START domain
MPMPADKDLDLVITRRLDVPRALVWRAWTDPVHLKEWWCPKPWTTEVKAFDFVPGGAFHTLMTGPDGDTSDNPGAFLEIVPQAKIVFTSALVGGWRPAASPWMPMTAIITMADEGAGTRYVATVMHPDEATRAKHAEMGFADGWSICIDQLATFARALA